MAVLLGDHVRVASPSLWLEEAMYGKGRLRLHPLMSGVMAAEMARIRLEERGEQIDQKVVRDSERLRELIATSRGTLFTSPWDDPIPDIESDPHGDEMLALAERLVDAEPNLDLPLVFPGFLETAPARNEGILELALPEGEDTYHPSLGRQMIMREIADAFESSAWPFVDEVIDQAMRTLEPDEGTSKSATRGSAAGLISTRLFGRLSSFPSLKLQHVLELRSEFADDLVRLRSEIVSLASEASGGAWGDELAEEVERIFTAKVEPAILDFRKAIANSGWRELIIQELVQPATAVVAAGMLVAPGAAGSMAAVGAVKSVFSIGQRRKKATSGLESHPFYFFHQSGLLR